MTLLDTAPLTAAARQATENFAANLAALEITQPGVAAEMGELHFAGEWVFGRDGSLTARNESDQWHGGCSLPLRAGRAMLKNLRLDGVVGCLLIPSHAGQISATLQLTQPQQATVVVQPDQADVQMFLHCGDFVADIEQHRLWFITGENWIANFENLFDAQPGLPTPTQFIRLPGTPDEVINPLIESAQAAITRIAGKRSQTVISIAWSCSTDELLLIAPTDFRLWDDAGHAMVEALQDETNLRHLNPDDPAQASALNLATFAKDAKAIVIPNRGRAELPIALPSEKTIVSWITQPRLWRFDPNYPHDALLLADESWLPQAKRFGWPAERLAIAEWPTTPLPAADEKTSLALIADTHSLEIPTAELNSSSHHVLWEMIRSELLAKPFCMGSDVGAYLDSKRKKLGIAEEGFNRELFICRLVLPCFIQAIARRLLESGLPLRIYGAGWEEVTGLVPCCCGQITTRERFVGAVARATHIVYPWPIRHRHAIDALSRPVMMLCDASAQELRKLASQPDAADRTQKPLHIDTVRRMLVDR
jgi:hypothetical protein